MKRTIIIFILAAMLVISAGVWIFSSGTPLQSIDVLSFGILFILIAFAIFIGYKRIKASKRGEPAEDELSKKVMLKTSSLSYYISLYIWLVMIYISEKGTFETHELMTAGLLGMAITFACCWLIFHFRGIRNE